MNISSVSFGSGSELNPPSFMYAGNKKTAHNSSFERTPKNDCFRKQTVKNNKKSKRKSIIPLSVKTFAAGAAAALLVNAGVSQAVKPDAAVTVPYDNTVSVSEIADIYNIDEEAVYSYNNITEATDLEELTELNIPSSFDYMQDKIDSLRDKLYNSNLSEEERAELEEKLDKYIEKQEYQQSIATVYTDGKYVYYILKEIDENSPEEIYEQFKNGINVETFKEIYDIKDGAISGYNALSYTIISVGPEDNPEYYRDYSNNTLKAGRTIKVPVSSVKTNNISFDY